MKRYRKANSVFLLAVVLFIAALIVYTRHPSRSTSIFYFLAQSLVIGCFADWFAIEALFRNPFHIPHFHPVIPFYRSKIIKGLEQFINGTLFQEKELRRELRHFSVLSWLEEEGNPQLPEQEEKLARFLIDYGLRQMGTGNGKVLSWLQEKGADAAVKGKAFLLDKMKEPETETYFFDLLVSGARSYIQQGAFQEQVSQTLEKLIDKESGHSWKQIIAGVLRITGTLDTKAAARSLQEVLSQEMGFWLDDKNPKREMMLSRWQKGMTSFLQDEELEKAILSWTQQLIHSLDVKNELKREIGRRQEEWRNDPKVQAEWTQKAASWIDQGRKYLLKNQEIRFLVDQTAQDFIISVCSSEKARLPDKIHSILSVLNEKEFNEFIESKVWHELEGIRLNGAIVGLVGGAVLYFIIFYVYLPFCHWLFA